MFLYHLADEEIEFHTNRDFQSSLISAFFHELHPNCGIDGRVLRHEFDQFRGFSLYNCQRNRTHFGVGRNGVFGELHLLHLLANLSQFLRRNLIGREILQDILHLFRVGKSGFKGFKTAQIGQTLVSLSLRGIDGKDVGGVFSHRCLERNSSSLSSLGEAFEIIRFSRTPRKKGRSQNKERKCRKRRATLRVSTWKD